ncbi:pirin-like C-terminal cupin domain-containing protein [Palleronia sediminis]|uniref:pirin-like C-terminal cupin domain-containing protein n=1 Tax=Palleronia sediminis TaxID=2547833 RepID=UPI0023EA520A|nr:pirin-like C-terminal cupin domain-containing protein [Palleronia sediminis]
MGCRDCQITSPARPIATKYPRPGSGRAAAASISLRSILTPIRRHRASPTPPWTLYADVQLAPGASFTVEPSVTERALYTISVEIEVAGQSFAYAQLLVLRPGDQIVVRAVTAARVMLFGGESLEGPRWIWWNFISSRKERIEQAQEECHRGRFDTVPGDEADFIPLPKMNTKPRRTLGGVFYP